MPQARIKHGQLTDLSPQQARFLIEYLKDFNRVAASERANVSASALTDWFKEDHPFAIKLGEILERELDDSIVDAKFLLFELWDNHRLARQDGNLGASNAALTTIGKLAPVDAFSAEKVHVVGDTELAERLNRGRQRLAKVDEPEPEEDDLNFL